VDPELRKFLLALEDAAPRPSAYRQRASRALRTNQPSLSGTTPCSVAFSCASGTIGGAYLTAEWLKTRMETIVNTAAKTATTSRLSEAIAVASCSFQMLCSPVLSPSKP
jgi:hypothetical protein